MDLWELTLTSLLLMIVLPAVYGIVWFVKTREEKKFTSEGTIRTRTPKIVSVFFLGFALLVLCGGTAVIIYSCITNSENTTVDVVVILSVLVAVFSGLGFFGYAWGRFNFVIADDEGLLACRLFLKKRYCRYEEIGYFYDTTWLGFHGEVKIYDKDNIKICSIEALSIGATAVLQRLREHGVEEKSTKPNHH